MIEISRENFGDCDYVSGYEIKSSDSGEIIDFIQHVLTDNNKWGKKKVLSTSIIHRRNLKDILNYLGTSREDFEKILKSGDCDVLAVLDAIEESKGILYHIAMPARFVGNGKGGFSGYNDSYNTLTVFINQEDYSSMFEDFDIFEDKAVLKAQEVLCSGQYVKLGSDLTKLTNHITEVLNNVVENGLLF